jgi:hypothetical protein
MDGLGLSIAFTVGATNRSGFAAFRKDCAPGENGGGDSVFGAASVFVRGCGQLGKNLGEFALGSGLHEGTQFTNAIFNASSGWHRGYWRRGGTLKMAEMTRISDTGAGVGRIVEAAVENQVLRSSTPPHENRARRDLGRSAQDDKNG